MSLPKNQNIYKYCYTSPPISLKLRSSEKPTKSKVSENLEARNDFLNLQAKYNQDSSLLRGEIEKTRKESVKFSERILELETDLKQQSKVEHELRKENKYALRAFSQIFGQKFDNLEDVVVFASKKQSEYDEDSQKIAKELCNRYQKLRDKYHKVKCENRILESTLESNRENAKLSSTNSEKILELNIANLKEEMLREKDAHTRENIEKDARITALETQISNYEIQINKILSQRTKVDSRTQLLDEKVIELTEEINDKDEEIEGKQKEIEELYEKIAALEEANAESKSREELLQAKVEDMSDRINALNNDKEELKKANEQKAIESNSFKNELQTSIAQTHELESRTIMLSDEIKRLNAELSEKEPEREAYENETEERFKILNNSLDETESVITQQRSEIVELSKLKTKLIRSLRRAMNLNENYEKIFNEMDVDLKHVTLSKEDLQENYSKEKEIEEKDFNNAFDDILDMVPVSLVDPISELHSLPKPAILKHVVELLLENNGNKDIEADEKYKSLEKKNNALLAQLNNCIEFMRKASKTQMYCKAEGRTEIMQQCARIGRYIDENNIYLPTENFARSSLFEPKELNDPEKILKIFYDFVPEEQIDQHPFVDLYTLFCCIVQINIMLMSSNSLYQGSMNERKRLEEDNLAIHKKLQDYAVLMNNESVIKRDVTEILSKAIPNPPSDVRELAKAVVTTLKGDAEKYAKTIKEEEERYTELMRYTDHEKDGFEREKRIFCEKATKIAQTIEDRMNEMKENYEEKIDGIKFKLSVQKKIAEDATKAKNEVKEGKQTINELNNRIDELSQEISEKDAEIEELNAKNQEKEDEKEACREELSKEIEEMKESMNKLVKKLLKYKERCKEAESKNSDVMTEVRTRTDSLAAQYGVSITRLQNELEEARNQLKNQPNNAKSAEVSQLKTEVAKLKLSERSLQRKVSDLEAALERERDSVNAKITTTSIAAKQNLENTKSDLQEVINSYREAMVYAANDARLSLLPDSELIEESVKRIRELTGKSDVKTFQEALHVKRALGINGEEESLFDAFEKINKSLKTSDMKVEELESQLSNTTKKLHRSEREVNRLEKSRVELGEWNRWAASLYRQICEEASPNTKSSQIRFVFEEQILASFGFQKFAKKIERLQTEKTILTNLNLNKAQPGMPIDSLRPITIATIFVRTIQKMSGTAHSLMLSVQPQE